MHADTSGRMPLHVALEYGACEAVVQLLCVPEVPALTLRQIVRYGMLICSEGLGMIQSGGTLAPGPIWSS